MRTVQTVSRQELYDLAWSMPMTKLGEHFGVSDVGIRKICLRHHIPLPEQGHWNRVTAGHKVTQTPLPPREGDDRQNIRVLATRPGVPDAVADVAEQTRAREEEGVNKIIVSIGTEPQSKMGTWLAARLSKACADGRGVLTARSKKSFPVEVTEGTRERAIAIIDALALGLIARGYKLVAGEEVAELEVASERIGLSLRETVKRQSHTFTEEERSKLDEFDRKIAKDPDWRSPWPGRKSAYERKLPDYDYFPTGKLKLELSKVTEGMRKSWSDAKVQRLENLLNDIVATLEPHAELLRLQREEREEQRRQWKLEEECREQARRRQRIAAKRHDQTLPFIERLEQAKRYSNLIDYLEATFSVQRNSDNKEYAAFLVWARAEKERLLSQIHPDAIASSTQGWSAVSFSDERLDDDRDYW
ncbi:MAG: hypothetical protein EP347_00270 [Alphaproteobacteria bacterium]|nr:MAG: hypothetical protein EP347_00270 [Alphaproteobacteria bacterium]